MKSSQEKVDEFVREHDLEASSPFRILDLVAEIGEIAGDAAKSSGYGRNEQEMEVSEDEIGDAIFALLAMCSDLDINAEEALEASLSKYKSRIDSKGDPGSG